MPEEDQETQRALMERVLEILLEVEKLTSNERTQVQHGLAFIRSDDKQPRYACCLFDSSQVSLF